MIFGSYLVEDGDPEATARGDSRPATANSTPFSPYLRGSPTSGYGLSPKSVADRPLTNRASLVSYVQKKNRRLGAIPLLVDLSWHGGTCLGRYCVCRAATLQERIEEYARDDRLYT